VLIGNYVLRVHAHYGANPLCGTRPTDAVVAVSAAKQARPLSRTQPGRNAAGPLAPKCRHRVDISPPAVDASRHGAAQGVTSTSIFLIGTTPLRRFKSLCTASTAIWCLAPQFFARLHQFLLPLIGRHKWQTSRPRCGAHDRGSYGAAHVK